MLYDNFETKNYKYSYFDWNIKEHCEFIELFNRDKELAKFVPGLLLELIAHSEVLRTGVDQNDVSFVVEKDGLILGAIIIHEYSDCCYLRFATAPIYRGYGIATSILKDISDNILDSNKNIESIRGVISNKNAASKKATLKAGFEFLREHAKKFNQSEYIYRK
jgi:RimJ/RimL family protein N-acetyltransferase